MKKFALLSLLLINILTVAGCALKNAEMEHLNTSASITEELPISGERANHIQISLTDGPEPILSDVPLYYQQDFDDEYNGSTIAVQGSLLTCLSMLESYEKSSYISPDIYNSNFVNAKTQTADELILDFAQRNELTILKENLNIENLSNYLVYGDYIVLLHIPHASVFGKDSSFMLLTGVNSDGMIYVRDPNKYNLSEFATYDETGQPSYHPYLVCQQASSSAYIYIFTHGEIDDFFIFRDEDYYNKVWEE